ncbi:hypothetical protein [Mycolicibacterium fluoranthenivorans]|uniref:Uncharacterized protein n=1 Tax=Mycolicibacterium fluoranthenivorans TaxID=258505 RepID=A0A7X5TZM4_9MYCO|nr:hypothetical protein [Mycolicibacterium fluoranthenivorans]MCV7358170.1 hypothetical protein [Mycolicibacterium fluoranthenivorans]NIH95706.1 hypothetical protein [Mycolicibacterium fluoranthenivorans]
MLCKNGLHYLRVCADYMAGECRQCWTDRQERYRVRRAAAQSLYRDIEGRATTFKENSK